MAFLEVGIIEIAVLHYKRLEHRRMLNLKIATNLNKLDVMRSPTLKACNKCSGLNYLNKGYKSKQMKQIHDIFSHPQPWPTSPNLTH